MPSVSIESVVNNTDVYAETTTWTDTMSASSALASGDEFLVLGVVNNRPDGVPNDAYLETRFGTTRLCLHIANSAFMQFNTGDAASGHTTYALARVTGNGTDTINHRRQAPNAFPSAGQRVSNQQLAIINLTELGTENSDYWWSETANSETASTTPNGTTWERAGDTALATVAAQAGEVQFTAPSTGDYLVIGYVEGFYTPASSAAADEILARLRLVTDPAGTPSTATIGPEEQVGFAGYVDATPEANSRVPILLTDVRTLTASTTYRFQWEVSTSAGVTTTQYSRFRMLVIRLGALTNSAYITNAGNIQATASEVVAANSLTFNFGGTAHNVLILGGSTSTNDGGAWGHRLMRHDPSGTPTDYPEAGGRLTLFPAATAQAFETGMFVLSGVTGSQEVVFAATGDGGTDVHRWGRNYANSAAARTPLVALMMDVPAAGGAIDGSSAGTSTVTGALAGVGALASTSSGLAVATGTLSAPGEMVGTSTGVASQTATLTGTASLVTTADTFADYDDPFDGSVLGGQWGTYLGTAVARAVVGGGEFNVEPTGGGVANSFWFNANDGILHHLNDTITGDFDMRVRTRVRNAANTGSPTFAAGEYRFAGIAIHDPDRTTVRNYAHAMLGSDPAGTDRVEWKTTDDSVSTFASIAGAAPLDYDLRLVRAGQQISAYYRRIDSGETLASNVSWSLLQLMDRNDNAVPARASAVNFPAALQVGLVGGYAGPQVDHDIQAFFSEFRLRTGVPETASGRGTALATLLAVAAAVGLSAGAAVASATLAAVGSLVGTSTGVAGETATLTATGVLAGTGAGGATVTGTLSTPSGEMIAQADGIATTAAALTGAGALATTSTGTATAAASLTGLASLTGTSLGLAVQVATLAGVGELSGSSAGVSAVTGSLVEGAINGSSSGLGSATGALTGTGALVGLAAATSVGSGSLIGFVFITADAAGVATESATLAGTGELTGISAGTAVAIGDLTSQALAGTSAATSSAVATLSASGALVGVSAGIATVTGTFGNPLSITTLDPIDGPPTRCGRLTEIIGTGFRLPTAAAPEVIPVPVAPPSVRVTFGGVASPRVSVISSTRLLVEVPARSMPIGPNGVTLGTEVVDVVVTNIDDAGVPIGGAFTATDAYTYVRPGISYAAGPYGVPRVTAQLVDLLRSEVLANTVLDTHVDYDPDSTTPVIEIEDAPQLVLTGPSVTFNSMLTYRGSYLVPGINPGEGFSKRRHRVIDLGYEIMGITSGAGSSLMLSNLIELLMIVIDRNTSILLEHPYGSGDYLPLELRWVEDPKYEKVSSEGRKSNVRVFRGTLQIVGYPVTGFPGIDQDAIQAVGFEVDVTTLEAALQIGDNLPITQGAPTRSPPDGNS